jgi:hypothetical protein
MLALSAERWDLQFRMHDRRVPIALAAAALFVLQSLFSSWAVAGPAQPLLDAFGNPLCITSVDGHAPAPPGDHSRPSDCCMLGCAGFSHALADAGDASSALVHPPVPLALAYGDERQFSVEPAEHNPGSPRAPPLTI